MADVLEVDVEDKGGFSEDEGDGKSINNLNYCNGATVNLQDYYHLTVMCAVLQREFKD